MSEDHTKFKRYTDNFEESRIGDIELSQYLLAKDKNWTWQKIGDFNLYFCNDKVEAICKFDNEKLTKKVWLRK